MQILQAFRARPFCNLWQMLEFWAEPCRNFQWKLLYFVTAAYAWHHPILFCSQLYVALQELDTTLQLFKVIGNHGHSVQQPEEASGLSHKQRRHLSDDWLRSLTWSAVSNPSNWVQVNYNNQQWAPSLALCTWVPHVHTWVCSNYQHYNSAIFVTLAHFIRLTKLLT